jgi:hypothetical protein
MNIAPEILVALLSVTWTAGMFVGLFAARYMSKKECKERCDQIWQRIDSIQDGLTGQPIHFELKMVSHKTNSKTVG